MNHAAVECNIQWQKMKLPSTPPNLAEWIGIMKTKAISMSCFFAALTHSASFHLDGLLIGYF